MVRGRCCLLLLLLVGCEADKRKEAATHPGFTTAGVNARKPVTEQTATFVKEATAEATHLQRALPRPAGQPPESYFALRRAVAAGAPFFRSRAKTGSEILFGPPGGADSSGALAALDMALAKGDASGARDAVTQVIRGLRRVDHELTLAGVPPEDALQLLSDAAYALGLMFAEAYGEVPVSPRAVLADLRGHLDGMAAVARAVMRRVEKTPLSARAEASSRALLQQVSALQRQIANAGDAHALARRAELIAATGDLGVAARRLATAMGVKVDLPYRVARPRANNGLEEPVHALSLPRPPSPTGDIKRLARIGGRLFVDRRLSQNADRACVDCHQPEHAYGDAVAMSPSPTPDEALTRNTPTLLYSALHAARYWHGLVHNDSSRIVTSHGDMGFTEAHLMKVMRADASYPADLKQAGAEPNADGAERAFVAFAVEHLSPGMSHLDRFARGEAQLSPEVSTGFDVFAGKARCARCHLPPVFGGARPPGFSTAVYATLGVPRTPQSTELDGDLGRAQTSKRARDKGAFRVPTLRNLSRTAPYFHHGGYRTLTEVIDFYNRGGGRGLGLEVPHQDADVMKLELSEAEVASLLAFMTRGLTDPDMPASPSPPSPPEAP